MYFAATGLSKDLDEVMPFGCLTGSFGPTGVRGVLGDMRFGDPAKTVTLSEVRLRSSTWRIRSCSNGSAKGLLSRVCRLISWSGDGPWEEGPS